MSAARKEERLVELVGAWDGVLVAFSGGVDSSYLAFIAHRVLGPRAVAVTALSPAVSSYQRNLAADFAGRFSLNHRFVETAEMLDPNYTTNPSNRCYFCKSELYGVLGQLQAEMGLGVTFDGTNRDDVGDYRPGRRAGLEHDVVSPLQQVGFSKAEIRECSRRLQLPCWDLPAMPCLSSRFPYGVAITSEKLTRVEKAEEILRSHGFMEFRVRHYEETARLEISPLEMKKLDAGGTRNAIRRQLGELGYHRIAIDPRGFRSGSLNETLVEAVDTAASAPGE